MHTLQCRCAIGSHVAGNSILAALYQVKIARPPTKQSPTARRSHCLLVPRRACMPSVAQCNAMPLGQLRQAGPLLIVCLRSTRIRSSTVVLRLSTGRHTVKSHTWTSYAVLLLPIKIQQAHASTGCRARRETLSHQALPSYQNTGQTLRAPEPLRHSQRAPHRQNHMFSVRDLPHLIKCPLVKTLTKTPCGPRGPGTS